ncbi:hypothetical protein ACI2OX_07675 [Bacillus sp. N9]
MSENNSTYILNNEHQEEVKYKELFRVTEKFHATMETTSILTAVIETLHKVYPQYDYHLLMSNDSEATEQLPLKELKYHSENTAAISAYVNGTVEINDINGAQLLYAPLNGRQAVYGVLQVQTDHRFPLTEGKLIS